MHGPAAVFAQSSQPGYIPASTTAPETISRALRCLMNPSTDATSLSPGSSVSASQVARNACLAALRDLRPGGS